MADPPAGSEGTAPGGAANRVTTASTPAEKPATTEVPEPKLDVHAPHQSVHSWRDFFVHIATIAVGLLIAVGLEQTIEVTRITRNACTSSRTCKTKPVRTGILPSLQQLLRPSDLAAQLPWR